MSARTLKLLSLLALALALSGFFSEPAFAQGAGSTFSCNGGSPNGSLFSVGTNTSDNIATATDYQATNGQAGSVAGIFAGVLAYFRSTVGQIMSTMYCSIQNALLGPLGVLLTLFTVVLGIALVTGLSKFTYREAGTVLFKVALVWAFAMNADWGIGIAYQFFMGVAEEGSNIVLSAICGGNNIPKLDQPDTLFTSVFSVISGNGVGTNTGTTTTGCLNLTGAAAAGTTAASLGAIPQACASMFMIVFAMMLFLSPGIASFATIMVVQYVALYGRALLGYLTALVLISFLFILSPIFVSFALFKVTWPLFEKWISYLGTFAIQMIIIFGFLALLALVAAQLSNALFTFAGLLREYNMTLTTGIVTQPMTLCSICAYTMSGGGAGGAGGAGGVGGTGGLPTIQCGGGGGTMNDAVTGVDGSQVIPIMSLFEHQDFIIYVLSQTLAWWLIAYVLQEFLKKAPELARAIGGVPYAPGLGGDISGGRYSGLDNPNINYPGLGGAGAMGRGVQKWWENATMVRGGVAGALGGLGAYNLFRPAPGPGRQIMRPEVSGMRPAAGGGAGGGAGGPLGTGGPINTAGLMGTTGGPGGGAMLPTEEMVRAGIAAQEDDAARLTTYLTGVVKEYQIALSKNQGMGSERKDELGAYINRLLEDLRNRPTLQSLHNNIVSRIQSLMMWLKTG